MTRRKLTMGLVILLSLAGGRVALAQDAPADPDAPADSNVLPAQTGMEIDPAPQPEQFVPPAASIESFAGGTLALRSQATVPGAPVLIGNICRWTEEDAPFFQPVAGLTVTRFSGNRLYMTVTLDQVRDTLRGAGMNLALVSFGGATACAVNRTQTDDQESLQQWADAAQAIPAAATVTANDQPAIAAAADPTPLRSLRDILLADLSGRLQLDPNNMELSFDSTDEKIVKLVEPYFQFQVTPRNVSGLGDVSWDVTIVSNGQRHETHLTGMARLWQTQAILQNPVGYRQVLRDQDVDEKRILVERLPQEPLLTKAQAVGQETSRELKPGTVLTASMVDPALLARPGQIITVTVVRGGVSITAVAKAMEAGSYGQTIRARNDVDPTQVFEVTLTGPQEGTVNSSQDDNKSPIASAGSQTP